MITAPRQPFAPPEGFALHPGVLDRPVQAALAAEVLAAAVEAPFYQAELAGGRRMSVLNTNLGPLGWVASPSGYRYEPRHPGTGRAWPPLPAALLALWRAYAGAGRDPDGCLVNLYRGEARLGLHQDLDEMDFGQPVLSISLGDTAIFRLGGTTRVAPTRSMRLASGDVVVLGGAARRAFHGVDRILPGSSTLVPGGGRLNLTLRCAA
jgi:alkylated DNA repair protein (DNA oxidative demethylase)